VISFRPRAEGRIFHLNKIANMCPFAHYRLRP
jgi:hypothetical protein